eukprot:6212689-Pleurochrysis_carterae.AAC.1
MVRVRCHRLFRDRSLVQELSSQLALMQRRTEEAERLAMHAERRAILAERRLSEIAHLPAEVTRLRGQIHDLVAEQHKQGFKTKFATADSDVGDAGARYDDDDDDDEEEDGDGGGGGGGYSGADLAQVVEALMVPSLLSTAAVNSSEPSGVVPSWEGSPPSSPPSPSSPLSPSSAALLSRDSSSMLLRPEDYQAQGFGASHRNISFGGNNGAKLGARAGGIDAARAREESISSEELERFRRAANVKEGSGIGAGGKGPMDTQGRGRTERHTALGESNGDYNASRCGAASGGAGGGGGVCVGAARVGAGGDGGGSGACSRHGSGVAIFVENAEQAERGTKWERTSAFALSDGDKELAEKKGENGALAHAHVCGLRPCC